MAAIVIFVARQKLLVTVDMVVTGVLSVLFAEDIRSRLELRMDIAKGLAQFQRPCLVAEAGEVEGIAQVAVGSHTKKVIKGNTEQLGLSGAPVEASQVPVCALLN